MVSSSRRNVRPLVSGSHSRGSLTPRLRQRHLLPNLLCCFSHSKETFLCVSFKSGKARDKEKLRILEIMKEHTSTGRYNAIRNQATFVHLVTGIHCCHLFTNVVALLGLIPVAHLVSSPWNPLTSPCQLFGFVCVFFQRPTVYSLPFCPH